MGNEKAAMTPTPRSKVDRAAERVRRAVARSERADAKSERKRLAWERARQEATDAWDAAREAEMALLSAAKDGAS